MTKFEEEVKRPVIDIGRSSIKPALGKAVEFYTDKVKEYHNAFSDMNRYIDSLEAQLDYYKKDKRFEVMADEILELKRENQRLVAENLAVKTLVDNAKPQQALPVVPECVAEELDKLDFGYWISHSANLAYFTAYALNWLEQNRGDMKIVEYISKLRFGGYTVERPQLFYLKAKESLVVGEYDHVEDLWLDCNKNYTTKKRNAHKFTQSQINSMETGSYEQIEVEK